MPKRDEAVENGSNFVNFEVFVPVLLIRTTTYYYIVLDKRTTLSLSPTPCHTKKALIGEQLDIIRLCI